MNSAIIPKPKDDRYWIHQHVQYKEEGAKAKPDVVFMGDSLIQYMTVTQIWDEYFKDFNAVNFGIGGDRTEHVLWRVLDGELDNMSPKVVVILVGTNNINNTDQQVVDAILEIAKQIHARQPQARIIIWGIAPKGHTPNKYRDKVALINKGLSELVASLPYCIFQPVDPKLFVDDEGLISDLDMYDYLHLTSMGYRKICGPLKQTIENILQEFKPSPTE